MRALNAIKMERMFAKPFVAAMEGHTEGVEVIVRKPGVLNTIASAGWDGGESFLTFFLNMFLCKVGRDTATRPPATTSLSEIP